MNMLVICLLGCIAAADAVSLTMLEHEEWKEFKMTHRKNYDANEDQLRFMIFLDNKLSIARHNQRYAAGEVTFKVALNAFADLAYDEIMVRNGYNQTIGLNAYEDDAVTFLAPANVDVPDAMDWRTKGAVTPIKKQGHCLSCWAFSATGALEGQHFRSTGKLVSLSEQNLVDCDYLDEGCVGGNPINAFEYIKENGGIDTEQNYPYEGKNAKCRYNAENSGATDKGFVRISKGNEKQLTEAVATQGPVSVAIDASSKLFRFYSGGIYYDPNNCNQNKLNHAVLVVGYDTDDKSRDFYIVKNSWGTTWGEKGYVKMARNRNNHCGIASDASYPLV